MTVATVKSGIPTENAAPGAIVQKVQQLQNTFSTGQTKSYTWRVEQLQQLKKMTIEQEAKILAALKSDLNKGTMESWSSEVGFIIGDVKHTIKHLKKWMKPRKVSTPVVA